MNKRDLKILWSSNSPWSNSGYGRFTDDFSQLVKKDGWDIRLITWAGLAAGTIEYKGIYCYPQVESVWGDDALFHHGNHFGAHVRFSMQDVPTMNPMWLQQMPNWIPYTPIDREDVQPQVLESLKYAYKILTFSKFGQKALESKGFASTMIPEGVDTRVFKPLDKIATKKEMGFPLDKIVVGMVGANKPDGYSRKGWQQALDAFKLFHDKHPDSIFFYEFNQGGGFDIPGYAHQIGLHAQDLMTPNLYMAVVHGSAEVMNKWLNCFDFLLHVSTTEGFGLIITEAQAAGTPVIIQNIMSMPELIIEGKTGEAVSPGTKIWAQGYIYIPDPREIADKMETIYGKVKEDEAKISSSCRAWIVDNYNLEKIYKEKWTPYLENLQEEFIPEEVKNDKR